MDSFEGLEGIGMSKHEVRKFLIQSRSTLLLGTTNADGTPMIHPVWYYFDSAKTKLYFYTEPALKKTTNIKQRRQVYFDVDDDRWPYKGVKGKGTATILTSKRSSLFWGAKILAKYIKKGGPLFRSALEKIKRGGYVVIEITPAYFTSWDFAKLDGQEVFGIRSFPERTRNGR
ncbi:MAG: pyridoxamine 5'-phosphate oxidase family protein [Nitrososphaerales archaeon]